MNGSRCDAACEEGVVPGGNLPAQTQRALAFGRAAKAETIWIAAWPVDLPAERREVLPSMVITSAVVPSSASTQAAKQRWNCTESRLAKISPR